VQGGERVRLDVLIADLNALGSFHRNLVLPGGQALGAEQVHQPPSHHDQVWSRSGR